MSNPVWGTFSVIDHTQPEAFLREVLLYDTLVVPYPRDGEERRRWLQPNDDVPSESWDPDRLDQLLHLLGIQSFPSLDDQPAEPGVDGHRGARIVRRMLWDQNLWDARHTNAQVASGLAGDPFQSTALMVAGLGPIPDGVEAIAAYSSRADWRSSVEPQPDGGNGETAASALLSLARPLLIPRAGGSEWDKLREAIDLARDPAYARIRTAYHDYFRELMAKVAGDGLADKTINPMTLEWARDQLATLWTREREFTAKDRRWSRVETGVVTTSALGSVGVALTAAIPPLAAGVAVLGFAGWAIGKWARDDPEPTLSGASMFVEAERKLAWMAPDPGARR